MKSAKKSKRRAISPIGAAKNAVRGALLNDAPVHDVITRSIKALDEEDFASFSHWIAFFPAKKARVRPPIPITALKDLTPSPLAKESMPDLHKQILWVIEFLRSNSASIQQYLELLSEYEAAWLAGKLELSLEKLDEIEAKLGLSIWGIEARIALLQQSKGLEAQKEFVKRIHSECPNTVAGFIAYFISQRNEESVSFSRYARRVEKAIDSQKKIPEAIKKYMTAQLAGLFEDGNSSEISDILSVASNISIIDAYETLIFSLQAAIQNECDKRISDHIAALSGLGFSDWRIGKLQAFATNSIDGLQLHPPELASMLLRREYEELIRAAEARLLSDPGDVQAINYVAAAMATSSQTSTPTLHAFQSEILRLLIAVHGRGEASNGAANDILKLHLNMRSVRPMGALTGYLASEWGERPQLYTCGATSSFLNSPYLSVQHWQFAPRSLADAIVERFARERGQELTVAVAAKQLRKEPIEDPSLEPDVKNHLNAISALYSRDLLAALRSAKDLAATKNTVARRIAAKIELHCLLEMGKFDEAIRRIASYCSEDNELRFNLPIQSLLGRMRWRDLKHLRKEISLPIVLDLHFRTFDDAHHETNRRIAYDEFLRANGVRRPLDLLTIRENFDEAELIYFLRWVAVPQVMDVSFDIFPTSRALEEERIQICSRLAEIDEANSSEYIEEVRRTTTALSVQDGLRAVDSSRVHVNTEAVALWAEKELKESFERYKSLLKAKVGFGSPEDFESAMKRFNEGDRAAAVDFLRYPAQEGDNLLIEIFDAIKEKYLIDPDYGLDAYLSMRIRHGSLEGHMRGPLQEQHLIVQKDNALGKYDDNIFWADKLPLRDFERELFFEAFRTLSRRYDEVIEDLTKNKLQINKPEKTEGIFQLSIDTNPLVVHFVRSRIQESTGFEEFLSLVFFGIDVLLEPVLARVRDHIIEEVKPKVYEAIEDCRLQLESSINANAYQQINSAIADVMPAVQASIDRVADWFGTVQKENERVLRTVDEIVDIGIEATKLARRGFEPKIEKHIDYIGVMSPTALSEFTDILFTTLDNVYKHSGNRVSPWVKIRIEGDEASQAYRKIRFYIESEVVPGTAGAQSEEKLNRIRQQMGSGEYRRHANLEGGSGLLKLKKFASLDSRQTFSFGLTERNSFFVDLTLYFMIGTEGSPEKVAA